MNYERENEMKNKHSGSSFDSFLEEIHQVIESSDGDEVGRRFEMRLDVLEQNSIAETADSFRAEARIGFPITKVTFREVTDVVAPQQIGSDGTGGIFHL